MRNNKIYIITPEEKIFAQPLLDGKVKFQNTYTPGVYQLFQSSYISNSKTDNLTPANLPFGAESAGSFTVNIDPIESSSIKISNEEINNLLPKANIIFSNGYKNNSWNKTNKTIPLFTYFMMLVGAILLFEGWLVRNE